MLIGLVWDEFYNWHSGGDASLEFRTQPGVDYWENAESKRRIYSLIVTTPELQGSLLRVEARDAVEEELLLFHTPDYVARIKSESELARGGEAGECARFSRGGYAVAVRSVGGLLAACEAVLQKRCISAYALIRPPGHHARASFGMGFCIFNNIVIAAKHIQRTAPTQTYRVAIVDYDVHHGNGTQEAFYQDGSVLFISIHQDSNYPHDSGGWEETGAGEGEGTTINIPLPPGSGHGAYMYALTTLVLPALRAFRPDFILVSSGFDGSFADPLASMMLHSGTYGAWARALQNAANELCDGRLVFAHEGGYSKDYVPYCGVAVVDQMAAAARMDSAPATLLSEERSADPYLDEAKGWGGQELQRHQFLALNAAYKQHVGSRGLLADALPPKVPEEWAASHGLERFLSPEQDPHGVFRHIR